MHLISMYQHLLPVNNPFDVNIALNKHSYRHCLHGMLDPIKTFGGIINKT